MKFTPDADGLVVELRLLPPPIPVKHSQDSSVVRRDCRCHSLRMIWSHLNVQMSLKVNKRTLMKQLSKIDEQKQNWDCMIEVKSFLWVFTHGKKKVWTGRCYIFLMGLNPGTKLSKGRMDPRFGSSGVTILPDFSGSGQHFGFYNFLLIISWLLNRHESSNTTFGLIAILLYLINIIIK